MSIKEHQSKDDNIQAWPIFIIFMIIITIAIFYQNTHSTPPGYYSVKKYCFNCYSHFTKDYKTGTPAKRPETCPKCGVADSN